VRPLCLVGRRFYNTVLLPCYRTPCPFLDHSDAIPVSQCPDTADIQRALKMCSLRIRALLMRVGVHVRQNFRRVRSIYHCSCRDPCRQYRCSAISPLWVRTLTRIFLQVTLHVAHLRDLKPSVVRLVQGETSYLTSCTSSTRDSRRRPYSFACYSFPRGVCPLAIPSYQIFLISIMCCCILRCMSLPLTKLLLLASPEPTDLGLSHRYQAPDLE
jgi:hypothetical protein